MIQTLSTFESFMLNSSIICVRRYNRKLVDKQAAMKGGVFVRQIFRFRRPKSIRAASHPKSDLAAQPPRLSSHASRLVRTSLVSSNWTGLPVFC